MKSMCKVRHPHWIPMELREHTLAHGERNEQFSRQPMRRTGIRIRLENEEVKRAVKHVIESIMHASYEYFSLGQ